jgi:hypothetical protein
MHRAEFLPLRLLTRWFPRLLMAGSFALGACNASDTIAPSADDQGISAAKAPTGQACIGCPVVSSHILFIAYTADWIGFHQIYTLSVDGIGGGFRPTPLDKQDQDPAWSY